MSTESNNPVEDLLDGNLAEVLKVIGNGKKIKYFDIRSRSGLVGEELDGSLEKLEQMGRIRSERLRDSVQYWRVTQTPPQSWYTVDEAAQYLRVSRRTIYQLVKDMQLASYKVGRAGHRRFKQEDIDAVMRKEQDVLKPALREATLTASDDPVLAEWWNNDRDAEYDKL